MIRKRSATLNAGMEGFYKMRTAKVGTTVIRLIVGLYFTYDHRTLKIRLPVRSAIYKQCTGGLVVRWVTTSESPLLYVFGFLLVFFFLAGG
jgi:hypothetical protein